MSLTRQSSCVKKTWLFMNLGRDRGAPVAAQAFWASGRCGAYSTREIHGQRF